MTRDEIRPGVTILVPAGADPLRPRHRLRLRVTWVGNVSDDGERIRVNGDLMRLDGSPSRSRNFRTFSTPPWLELALLTSVEA